MPEHTELRAATLWCAECEDESPERAVFAGRAWYTVHTVEEPGAVDKATFHRAAAPCPNNPNHTKIGHVTERPGGWPGLAG